MKKNRERFNALVTNYMCLRMQTDENFRRQRGEYKKGLYNRKRYGTEDLDEIKRIKEEDKLKRREEKLKEKETKTKKKTFITDY